MLRGKRVDRDDFRDSKWRKGRKKLSGKCCWLCEHRSKEESLFNMIDLLCSLLITQSQWFFFPGPSTHILMPFPSQCPKAVVSEPSLQFSLASFLSPFPPLSSLSLSSFFCKLIAFSYFQNLLNSSTRETKLPRNSFQTSALRWLIRVSTHIASSLVLGRCINYYCDKKSKTVKWGKGCVNPTFTSLQLWSLGSIAS